MNKGIIRLSIFLVLLVSLTIFIVATGEILIISVSDVNTTAGATNVSVPIKLDNNVTVYGLQLSISHHPDLIFKNISLTSRMSDAIIEANDVDGEILIASVLENGISEGNGTIINLIFDISSSANGTYSLNSTEMSGADIDTLLYSVEFIPGNMTVN